MEASAMSDARSSSDSHGLRQKLSSLSKGDLIEELIGALMKVTELSARPGSVAQRPIDSGGPVTGEQEPVGWQWHVGENCWTQCDRPSDEELRTKPDKFRPVYLGRMISAPASHDFRNSGESDLSVTPDCAGAGTANLQRWRASLEKALQAERDYWSSIGGVPAQRAVDCGALEDLISTFEQMRGYPEGDSNDPCFDLCGMPCCNEFGCLHAKVRAVRALALPSTSLGSAAK
jgi:hypothetical protein